MNKITAVLALTAT